MLGLQGEKSVAWWALLSEAGVGPNAALDALFRFMPTPLVLRSGDADSVVGAGFKESLLNPLRPCTVGNQPFSLLWILSDCPSRCLYSSTRLFRSAVAIATNECCWIVIVEAKEYFLAGCIRM